MSEPYTQWGFSQPPFQTSPLPSTPTGEKLLLGRSKEIDSLIYAIQDYPKLPTIEGPSGLGKTSLFNVALHVLYQRHNAGKEKALYLPCEKLQFRFEEKTNDFIHRVFFAVAQTLIRRKSDLLKGTARVSSALERWLNSPEISSPTFGLSINGIGGDGSLGRAQNTSTGFAESGFRFAIERVLEELFPPEQGGGIVCLIDNLELLRHSERAKSMLEELRDDLFGVKGLRFALCGSQNIVRGVASSTRMSGYLHRPVMVGKLEVDTVTEIFMSRVRAYAQPCKHGYLPLNSEGFVYLHNILQGNLRDTLAEAANYCSDMNRRNIHPKSDGEKHSRIVDWVSQTALENWLLIRDEVKVSGLMPWIKHAMSAGEFSTRDKAKLGWPNQEHFEFATDLMVQLEVLTRVIDPLDERRQVFQPTPKGCFIDFHLLDEDAIYRDEL